MRSLNPETRGNLITPDCHVETNKTNLENSLDALIDKAENCSDLADAQRESADKQHLSAHKLEKLSRSLIRDAEAIKNELKPAPEE